MTDTVTVPEPYKWLMLRDMSVALSTRLPSLGQKIGAKG